MRRGLAAIALRAALSLWAVTLLALAGCAPVARPGVDFAACADGRAGGLDVAFTPVVRLVDGHRVVREVWEFGDASAPQEAFGLVAHRYAGPGTYAVTLTVTDDRGVRGTATRFIDVKVGAFIDPTWQLVLGYPPTLRGVVGNALDVPLREVVVRVRFYDPDGLRLGEGHARVTDLAPGERARFAVEAEAFIERVYYARVDVASFVAACDPYGATSPAGP